MSGERQSPLSPTARLEAELYAPVVAETTGTKATLRIFGRIDSDGAPWGVSATDVQAALDGLPDDVTSLEVQVQTKGGDAFEGIAIMNMLGATTVPTEAVVVGLAASAGSYIVQGADKVTMMPHAQMMIHRASPVIVAAAQAPDLRTLADSLDSIDLTMANIYAEKAGGTSEEWLQAMTPETWYTADQAVAAGLADGVRERVKTAGAKALADLDLTVFAYAGAEKAPAPFIPDNRDPQTPADQPVTPPNDPKENVIVTEIPTAGLVKALGLPDDADEDTILEAVEAKINASANPPEPDAAALAALAAKSDKVLVSATLLDELKANAKLGAEARAKQLGDERDETIQAAVTAGKISRERVQAWTAAWDKDPEGVRADLDSLEARFPVAKATGYMGGDTDLSQTDRDAEDKALDKLAGANV